MDCVVSNELGNLIFSDFYAKGRDLSEKIGIQYNGVDLVLRDLSETFSDYVSLHNCQDQSLTSELFRMIWDQGIAYGLTYRAIAPAIPQITSGKFLKSPIQGQMAPDQFFKTLENSSKVRNRVAEIFSKLLKETLEEHLD